MTTVLDLPLPHLCAHGMFPDSCRDCGDWSIDEPLTSCPTLEDQLEPSANARRLLLVQASTVQPERVNWLVTGFIPVGAITIVSGREGLGKSLLTLHWAAEMTNGKLTEQPADVIVIAAEDSPAHVIVPRLIAARANLDRIHFPEIRYQNTDGGPLMLPKDLKDLRDAINTKRVGMVIIDPLSSSLATAIDSHKDASVRQALDPLSKLAAQCQVAVIAVMHQNKAVGSDLNTRVIGSRAFVAVARSHIYVDRDPSDESQRVAVLAKSNFGPTELPGIGFRIESFEVESGTTGVAVITGSRDVSARELEVRLEDVSDERNAASWLIEYLTEAGGEALKTDIEVAGKQAGFSQDQLRRARERQKIESVREKRPQGGSMWRLRMDR